MPAKYYLDATAGWSVRDHDRSPCPQLTDAMRDWLGQVETQRLLWDVIGEFRARFDLSSEDAGRILSQWIRECC